MAAYNRKRPADTQEAAWVADEDRFVLQQAKKKAAIRVKEGRAKPIDWLAVTLRFTDTTRSAFDDEVKDEELNIVDPEGVFEGLDDQQLAELQKDIDIYASLESNATNLDFWQTMEIICKDRRKTVGPKGRSQGAVLTEQDKLLGNKPLADLEKLEKQIRTKLRSDEPIDTEYWENLLQSLISWKARAKLRNVSQAIVENQAKGLRKQEADDAERLRERLSMALTTDRPTEHLIKASNSELGRNVAFLDPEPMLKAPIDDKGRPIQEENIFLAEVVSSRRKVIKLGFVPLKREQGVPERSTSRTSQPKSALAHSDEASQMTTALYEREVARGVGENEEVFASEEQVTTASTSQWSNRYRPRKPRYFNRVQMGYEWNKYNQTHYDHENPPPKVVQGYKFNVFYPDLIETVKAPTYKIEREGGRKRGESFAAAGEEDTCLIRFIAGPPYEDIAFRIVDKEWDYSAKRERGFKSSFDKGILQLHFQFKKIFYRK